MHQRIVKISAQAITTILEKKENELTSVASLVNLMNTTIDCNVVTIKSVMINAISTVDVFLGVK